MTQTRPKSLTSFLLVISLIDAFAGRVLFCWLFGTAPNMGAFGMFVGYNLACCLTAIPVIVTPRVACGSGASSVPRSVHKTARQGTDRQPVVPEKGS